MIVRPQAGEQEIKQTKQLQLTVTDRFNLHDLHVHFPVNCFSVVSGFSGAGKSTLIFDALVPALSATADQPAPAFVRDLDRGGLRHVVAIDATPVGKMSAQPSPPTQTFSTICDTFSPVCLMPKPSTIRVAISLTTSKPARARHAAVPASLT